MVGKQRGVEQFAGISLEDEGATDDAEEAANEDQGCCEVSPSVGVPVQHFEPFVRSIFGRGAVRSGLEFIAGHDQFFGGFEEVTRLFFRFDPGSKRQHASFPVIVHALPPEPPMMCADNTPSIVYRACMSWFALPFDRGQQSANGAQGDAGHEGDA